MLKNFIVSAHMDKALQEYPTTSINDVQIQAGAALTSERICTLNDNDGFDKSISGKNLRYCEATAMWWIYNNVHSPYIGIAHYRRRLDIDDDHLKSLMGEQVDLSINQIV